MSGKRESFHENSINRIIVLDWAVVQEPTNSFSTNDQYGTFFLQQNWSNWRPEKKIKKSNRIEKKRRKATTTTYDG